ncbi:hypothetical protein SASPL_120443 [Salvia splendens]|uniref:Uncharacterized protein n=1 Tax=Salvia splendens TaxID=180675 RepID=A0A8X8ZV84_SALSN|nr:hypothetical protein SASPL_120443 [Salvia splendens]
MIDSDSAERATPSMCTSSDSGSGSGSGSGSNGWTKARGVVLKTLVLMGGALLLKRLTKSTTRWDHARIVADSLAGEKASRDPDNYFNLRWLSCPAAEMVDGSRVLYFEQIFNRLLRDRHSGELLTNLFDSILFGDHTGKSSHIEMNILTDENMNRFFMVKPCSKEMKCDVEMSTYAIRDSEEYKNFCDRSRDQRPQPEEVIGDIAEHLTTIYLKRCDRGKRCLYEGSTPSDGFPNTWNGASYCTSELTVLKNSEIHTSDIGYDYEGNQVWGPGLEDLFSIGNFVG